MCQVKPLQPEIKMLERIIDPYMVFYQMPHFKLYALYLIVALLDLFS